MRYQIRCPECGHVAPWVPVTTAVTVKCVAPQLSRQLRRQALRDAIDVNVLATPCGAEFLVRPLPRDGNGAAYAVSS